MKERQQDIEHGHYPSQTSGNVGEQSMVNALEPVIKHVKMASFEGEQDANRHHFTRIQAGLAMFGYVFHHIIDITKNLDDNVFGRHEVLHSC